MLDARGRDIGEPTGEVVYVPATPELVARTRANITHVAETIYTRLNGYPTQIEILWEESRRLQEIRRTQGVAAMEIAIRELEKKIGA